MSARKFNNDLLIDQATGELRPDVIRRAAEARARHQFGVDVAATDIEFWCERVTAIAQGLSDKRRAELGKPVAPVATITPFGRERSGVRLSQF